MKIECGALSDEQYQKNFNDIEPPINKDQALIESARCYFCHDAPCIEACPTEINIPRFIRNIATENTEGAAVDILEENIMGATCARVCPVETLCEDACVRTTQQSGAVKISQLQRYATDYLLERNIQPFEIQKPTGKTIAIIGAGPAGLSCAHRLSILGHNVKIFEAKAKPGGLNEYGLAAYKMVDDIAQREIEFILTIGNIEINYNQLLGKTVDLMQLKHDYDAVFLGIGLGGTNRLALDDEESEGIHDAVDYISQIRQAKNYHELAIGHSVIIIGGGNTAIDIASQIKRLGARDVTLVYRRSQCAMGATKKEQDLAKTDGVSIQYEAKPIKINHQEGRLVSIDFERTKTNDGTLIGTGEKYTLKADMVFKAIGQHLHPLPYHALEIESERIKVDQDYQTNIQNIFAGGDCIKQGEDLTVQAVQDGKLAAIAINNYLKKATNG
jgi:dihydropyrimidine dehydrogenase (NAD+) subunit PreT